MKLLTITVPCYNSEAYLDRCVQSLLPGGEDIEILLVNDGSTDKTPNIINSYAAQYPSIVRAIHKENGGHGSAINEGLRAASGMYFKVVDSDDRLDRETFLDVLAFLHKTAGESSPCDMLVTNYVYDKEGALIKYVMKPKGLPKDRILTWHDIHHIQKYHFMLMHSLIYRTQLLRDCGLELPEHTFYVDNIYAFKPLPYVKTFWYKDVDLYLYYIGRSDQSVNEKNMVKQIDQYVRVAEIMVQQYKESCEITTEKACLEYMLNYLEIVLAIVCNYLNVGNTEKDAALKDSLWEDIAATDPDLAKTLRHRSSLVLTNLPGSIGQKTGSKVFHNISLFLGLN